MVSAKAASEPACSVNRELVYGAEIRRASLGAAHAKGSKLKVNAKASGKKGLLDDDGEGSEEGSEGSEGETFFTKRGGNAEEVNEDDATMGWLEPLQAGDWRDAAKCETLRHRFVTGDWTEGDPALNEASATKGEGSDDADADALDAGASATASGAGDLLDPDNADHGVSVENSEDAKRQPGESVEDYRERRAQLKAQLKEKFDQEYDSKKTAEAAEDTDAHGELQALLAKRKAANQEEFADMDAAARFHLEGAVNGSYVRVVFQGLPCEFVNCFDPAHPLVLGGLLPTEQNLGFVNVRFKRHRWSKKVLKSNNPLIISLGWRRFQTQPVYAIEDNGRHRFLKYTPEHMHCLATFYGPVSPPTTGLVAFQSLRVNQHGFRTAGTGVVLANDSTVQIVKKLKLTGHPYKIFKNTAYIRDMFHSSLEVAKFIGVALRTVSGVRGQIKKAITNPQEGVDGSFRATFEDKVLKSDIVFCRTWSQVVPNKYYTPVTTLLDTDKSQWMGMRQLADLRRERQVAVPYNADSQYLPDGAQKFERPNRKFQPLKIPKKLQAELPFSLKPKLMKPRASNKPSLEQRRSVVMEPEERKKLRIMQQLATVKNDKVRLAKEAKAKKRAAHAEKLQQIESKKKASSKEKRKRGYIAEEKGKVKKQRTLGGTSY